MPLMTEADYTNQRIKILATAMAVHLEELEAHCAVQTGTTGQNHAEEGKRLRRDGQKLIAMAKDEFLNKATA